MGGVFITFEGGEGSGKTTLIEALRMHFAAAGRDLLITREPGGTEVGERARQIVLQHNSFPISDRAELALFLASRAQHVEQILRPALNAGKMVLCDRFSDSSVVYQGYARGLGMREVTLATNFFAADLIPDLTLYLDLAPEIGLRRVNRGGLDRIESEKITFHEKVREGFRLLAKNEPQRIHTIDAGQSLDAVFLAARDAIGRLLQALNV